MGSPRSAVCKPAVRAASSYQLRPGSARGCGARGAWTTTTSDPVPSRSSCSVTHCTQRTSCSTAATRKPPNGGRWQSRRARSTVLIPLPSSTTRRRPWRTMSLSTITSPAGRIALVPQGRYGPDRAARTSRAASSDNSRRVGDGGGKSDAATADRNVPRRSAAVRRSGWSQPAPSPSPIPTRPTTARQTPAPPRRRR